MLHRSPADMVAHHWVKPKAVGVVDILVESKSVKILNGVQMYIQGVSTRDVERVMAEFGLESLSPSQVSRAATLLDEKLEAWQTHFLGAFPYLLLDISFSTGVMKRCAWEAWLAISPLFRRSGSVRMATAAFWASRLRPQRPKNIGVSSSRT